MYVYTIYTYVLLVWHVSTYMHTFILINLGKIICTYMLHLLCVWCAKWGCAMGWLSGYTAEWFSGCTPSEQDGQVIILLLFGAIVD